MATFLRRNLEGCYVFSTPPKAIIKADLPKCHTLTMPKSRMGVRKGCGKIHDKVVKPTPVINFKRQIHCLQQRWEEDYEPLTPAPLEGRLNVPVQTEKYLEQLSKAVEEKDMQVQTDPLLDRPPTPLFIPAKIGIDVATQIWEGELFDFENEVQPVLDIIVAQTLEQALMEVLHEDEMKEIIDSQRRYEKIRMAELAERQRLEEQDRRLFEERERRLKQHEIALRLEEELKAKVAATMFAKDFFKDIFDELTTKLDSLGFFADPAEIIIEKSFMPWLTEKVTDELQTVEMCRLLLDALIAEALSLDEKEARGTCVTPSTSESSLDQEEKDAIREIIEYLLNEVEQRTLNEAKIQKTKTLEKAPPPLKDKKVKKEKPASITNSQIIKMKETEILNDTLNEVIKDIVTEVVAQ